MAPHQRLHRPFIALLLGVPLAFLVVPAAATPTRQVSLGGMGAYYEDDTNVLRWYGSLPDYPNRAVLDLGRYDTSHDVGSERVTGQAGGLHVTFDDRGRWGTAAAYFHDRAIDSAPSDIFTDYPGGSFSFLYARQEGPLQAGLFFRGTSHHDYEAREGELQPGRGEFQHDYGLGVRADLSSHVYVDLAGEIRNIQFSYYDPDRELVEPGVSVTESFGLRARTFIQLSRQVALVPLFDYTREIRPIYSADLADIAALDGFAWRAGFGLNYLPDPDNLVIFSCERRESIVKQQGRRSLYAAYDDLKEISTVINPRVAVESRLLFWLTLRASAQYVRTSFNQYLYPLSEPGENAPPDGVDRIEVITPLTLGLACHFGHFSADLAVNNRAPFALGHALTGAGENETATFTSITLSYGF